MRGLPLVLSALVVLLLSAVVTTSAPARPRPAATVESPQVVLDWNATAAATLLASGSRSRSRWSTSA
jgi:hypothetical protein